MASLIREKSGGYMIQFTAPDGKRRTVRLGRTTKKVADVVCGHIEEIVAAKSIGVALSAPTARWVTTLSNVMRKKLARVGLVKHQQRVGLGQFMDDYISGRKSLKERTRKNLRRVAGLLKEYFGADRQIHTITKGDADGWREFMASTKGYALATIGRDVKRARQFFTAAVRQELIQSSPFEDINAPQQHNSDRQHYVPVDTIQKAIEAAPTAEWRLIIALSRFAGLRIPSELVALKWEDIDWEHGRIRISQPKLEHHAGKSFRVIPLFPRLRPYLEDQQVLADPGAEYVISSNRSENSNLRTHFNRILKRAMVEPWPRLFHNLRASFQTDICETQPVHVAAEWCGNSLRIAEKHYLSVTDDHFQKALEEQEEPQKALQKALHGETEQDRNGLNGEHTQEINKAASESNAISCGDIHVSSYLESTYGYPRQGSNL